MEKLDTTNIPQHIAIIMDGNGRWAAERGKPRSFGHQAGVDAVRRITSECTRLGVKYLTLYTEANVKSRVTCRRTGTAQLPRWLRSWVLCSHRLRTRYS